MVRLRLVTTAVACLTAAGALPAVVADASATCRDAGGRNELAFELDGNVTCVDAWSVVSCGSLGCPLALR